MRGSRANQTVCWSVYCGSHTFSRLSGFSAAPENLSNFFRPVGGWLQSTRITSNLRRDCEAIVLKRLDENPARSLGLTLFLPSPVQPALQGLRVLTGGKTRQKASYSQVLVQIGPVDVRPVSKDLKVITLLGRAMPQTRIPNQGDDNGAPVHQIHCQRLFAYGDASGPRLLLLSGQRTHTIPPVMSPGALERVCLSY